VAVVERDPSWALVQAVARKELVSASILPEVLWMGMEVGKAQVPESEADSRVADTDCVIHFRQEGLQ
jgi:hypothetical protein